MVEEPGPTLEQVVAKFKRGDAIHWLPSRSKRRPGHKGSGTYEGTLDGRVLVKYMVSTHYDQQKTMTIEPERVLLHGPQSFPLADAG